MVDTRQFMNITVRVRDQCLELQPNIFKAQNRKKIKILKTRVKLLKNLSFQRFKELMHVYE